MHRGALFLLCPRSNWNLGMNLLLQKEGENEDNKLQVHPGLSPLLLHHSCPQVHQEESFHYQNHGN